MGRDRNRKGHDTNRNSGPFVALPCVVLDCPAYLSLSHPAKALLLEIARQYIRNNNGRLLASRTYLAKRGWKSADTISRALRQLMDSKLIHQTVQGHRPNKASWYAVTWRALDRIPGYDAGAAETFERGGYAKQPLKNATLRTTHGLETLKTRPSDGPENCLPSPPGRPVNASSSRSPGTLNGHHLDKPSADAHFRLTMKPDSPALPVPVTQRAGKLMETIRKNSRDDVAIYSESGAGLTFEQLIAPTDPKADTGSLVAKWPPCKDLRTATVDGVNHD